VTPNSGRIFFTISREERFSKKRQSLVCSRKWSLGTMTSS
jgi:hypothetical protein